MYKMKIMLKHRYVVLFFGFCLLTIAGFAAPFLVGAAEFSADVTIVTYGKAAKGKLYVRGETYRMELVKADQSVVVLVDDKADLTRVLVHSKKIYLEMKNDDLGSAMNNPFVSYQISQSQYGSQDIGKEVVNGYPCTKKLTKSSGKDFLTAWISDKLGFPIKIVNHLRKSDFTELTNIKEGSQKEHLFRPPAGYVKMDRMPITPPSWAEDVPKAPILKVPFEKALSKGNIVRAPLIKGYKITVGGENLLEKKTAVTAVAFKNGNPVSKPSMSTFNVSRKGQKLAIAPRETIAQADEIVIRVEEGKALIRTELVEAPEGIVLKKEYIKKMSGKDMRTRTDRPFRLFVRDDEKDGADSRGKLVVYKGAFQNKEKIEEHALNIKNGQSMSWQYSVDKGIGTLSFDVVAGGIHVRLEYPEKEGIVPPSWIKRAVKETGTRKTKGDGVAEARATGKAAGNATAGAGSTPGGPVAVMFILDGSGSMWGQIDGKAKIAIAKEVMADLIDQLPADFHTGLCVYGHRRKGDCSDIEMLMPVGPHNPAAMKAKVQAVSPKGKTPLSESVRRAAQALRYTEERATVVLVSDGLETCDIDPCQLADELAMGGVDFTVHVIGFDISKEDQGRLRCLADKTGGLFLAAGSAGALREALFTTMEKVKEPPLPVVEDPGTATLSAPPAVPAGSEFQVQWEGPDSRDDYIAIAEKGSKDLHHRDYTYTQRGNPVDFLAPGNVGEYEMRYVHAHTRKVIGRTDIKVTPVRASVQAPASVDVAVNFDVQWQGPKYKSDYISIARPDQRPGSYVNYTYTREGSPLKVRAPSDPGTYEVRYILGRGNKLLAKTTIKITGVGASLDASPVADVATEFEVAWQGPANKEDYISVARPDQRPGSYVNYTYTRDGSPLKVRAPSDPGTYEVRYILGRGNKLLAKTTIEIKAVTAEVQAAASADMATEFEVAWQGPANKEDYISVARPDQRPGSYVNYTYTREGSPLKVRAPSDPGTYEVRYILGRGKKLLAKTTIEIKAVTAKVTAPASAKAGEFFEVTWEGPDNKSDYISIARPDQRPQSYKGYTYTSKGNPVKVKAPKEPGTYEVRYILARGKKLLAKTTINIKP